MTGSAFEKWQVVSGVIQNVLLLGTVLLAAYIGLKQTDIAAQQTRISQQLLDLEYELSVYLEYQSADQKLLLHNQGKHNIYLGGVNLKGRQREMYDPSRLIAVGGSHYIPQGQFTIDLDLYLSDERRLKYVLHSRLILDKTSGSLNVMIQPSATERFDWSAK